jgi:three-Cys-motif partner protein
LGELIDGDDGLPAEEVGIWAKDKHDLLCRYIDISKSTRAKYLGEGRGGAAFIDLFCSTGRCQIRETGEWTDGGAVAAWRKSLESKRPFTRVIIADVDLVRLNACEKRLSALGAPVVALHGAAVDTAFLARQRTPPHGLNFAFLDPYNLEALDFRIISTLSLIKRMDMLIHVSTMDLQRNLDKHLTDEDSAFDSFAPGWREGLQIDQSKRRTREDLFEYWRGLVAQTKVKTSDHVKLIKGSKNQRLYWLLLAASSDLAHTFWDAVSKTDGQGEFAF